MLMLPALTFDKPEVNLALELFLRDVHGVLQERLASVMLYGSVVFDDLAIGYGDLDFLAVVEGDLTEDDCSVLTEVRQPLRRGHYGVIGPMIEGPFLPRHMLNPALAGRALWWGTNLP